MLGIFDSGLGGITVVRRLREALPMHDIIFFADQAHVPYGDRSADELLSFMKYNLAWLDAEGVDAIVQGCNTTCATASRFGWPATRAPILDLIDSAAIAVERSGFKRIGVVATAATASSRAYTHHIRARVPHADVIEVAAPALVPLVEERKLEGDEPAQAVARACEPLIGRVDAVVLGCTHYPLLEPHFERCFGPGVTVLDPAVVQSERAVELVRRHGIPAGSGRFECTTTGDLDSFTASLHTLVSDLNPTVRYLEPANG
jgi:glutamate racemase